MKHTKTLLCLLLALAMLLCAGCKNTDGVQSTSEPAPESSAPETSAPTEETVAPTEGEAVSYQMGDKIQDFTVTTFDGKTVTLSEVLKEKDMVLINIWATWCGPCLRELAPEALPKIILERFAADSEFVFLPVAYTDSKESLDKFFAGDEQHNYAYLRDLTAMDPDKRVFGLYAEQGVPRSFVIDRNGRIVLGSLGAAQEELERIAAAIEKELSR